MRTLDQFDPRVAGNRECLPELSLAHFRAFGLSQASVSRSAGPSRLPSSKDIDPFLLLDHMGPIQIRLGRKTGFPDHPHCGFETVTYLLDGQMEHKDSFGNRGLLEAGDVQWMTPGSGLVHSEMPGR
jgi:redox-sensitive bicupin YhaK (pirin superfamily)